METFKFIHVLQKQKKNESGNAWIVHPTLCGSEKGHVQTLEYLKNEYNIQSVWMQLCFHNDSFIVEGINGVFLNLQYKTAHNVKKGHVHE